MNLLKLNEEEYSNFKTQRKLKKGSKSKTFFKTAEGTEMNLQISLSSKNQDHSREDFPYSNDEDNIDDSNDF